MHANTALSKRQFKNKMATSISHADKILTPEGIKFKPIRVPRGRT